MRKLTLFVGAIFAVMFWSCSGSGGGQVTTDSLASEYTISPLQARDTLRDSVKEIQPFIMTSQGITNVRIGLDVKGLVDSVPGLYQKIEREAGVYRFLMNDTVVISAAVEEGFITGLYATSPMIRVTVADREMKVGDELKGVEKLRGVRYFAPSDTAGEYYLWHNVRLIPSLDHRTLEAFSVGAYY